MDAIALQLKKVASNNIPVLWRPLHEAAGGWFWWGAKGAEPFKAYAPNITPDPETGIGISGACKLYPLDELPVTVSGGKIVVEKALLDTWTAQPKDRPVG